MNIGRVEFTPYTRSLDIFVSGCKGHPCVGCHNESLWSFTGGTPYVDLLPTIKSKVSMGDGLIDRIWVMGGEPLDQNKSKLLHFLLELESTGKEIWLFTRNAFGDIPPDVLDALDFVKVGAYIKEMAVKGYVQYGVELASVNQKVIKVH